MHSLPTVYVVLRFKYLYLLSVPRCLAMSSQFADSKIGLFLTLHVVLHEQKKKCKKTGRLAENVALAVCVTRLAALYNCTQP